jgi:hypothetical protein
MTRIAIIGSFAATLMLAGASTAFADDISRDLQDFRRDRADIHRDRAELRHERMERHYAARQEWRAILSGDLRTAERWDAVRRHEQAEINAIKRDLRRDRIDLAKDRADLRRDLRRY